MFPSLHSYCAYCVWLLSGISFSFWTTRKGSLFSLSGTFKGSWSIPFMSNSAASAPMQRNLRIRDLINQPPRFWAHLFVWRGHIVSWMDHCSFMSPFCFPLTAATGNSFSSCHLNIVKAIMCQVHGPIWRAAVSLCAEWSPQLIRSSSAYFLQLDFLNKNEISGMKKQ